MGPTGSYMLDFLYDVLLNAFAGVNIDLAKSTLIRSASFRSQVEHQRTINIPGSGPAAST